MEDGELATLTTDGNYTLESVSGEIITREAQKLEIFQDTSDSSKYEHAMLAEIINFETEQVTL